jgi:D-beta-D-heptose 7-phosphate kinase/D-beta-D-heptose 1-phosphate adenosyltransferase
MSRELLARMAGRRIAVIGDVMLDRYLVGDIERISPEAPVPVVLITERRHSPGGAANVAANLAALGAEPLLVGLIGDDEPGQQLRTALADHRIDASRLIATPGRPTTTKTRVVARGQQVVRVDEEEVSNRDRPTTTALIRAIESAVASAEALVLEDYDKGALNQATIAAALAAARARGIPVVVDPKFDHFFIYRGATVFKPNRRELSAALGPAAHPDDPGDLRALLQRLEAEHLLVTLGADGMRLLSRTGADHRIAGKAREVFDVSGAGDTVTAWVAAALAGGGSALEAATLANAAAAVEVSKRGVATVTPAEVLALLDGAE